LPGDTLRCHVIAGSNEGVGVALSTELSTDTEIAEFDLAPPCEKNVGGLDISVDDPMTMQVGQTVEHTFGDFAQDLFAGPSAKLLDFAVYAVQRSTLAELHADSDGAGSVIHEGSIILADVRRRAGFVE
jgi:hypothetical protein